jgi:2,4-dienoyl-CoA reductase-like NADH-dependent reductase (Old Yellow Enzyme family)
MHSSNGYLFNQFMSSAINDRKDAYGDSLTGRAKFLLDVIDAIREKVGRKFFLSIKLSVIENDDATLPWPVYYGEAIPHLVEGINVPAAVAIKQRVKIPVICTGDFQTAEGILRALGRGCDAVFIARPLLANPQLPVWLKEGWPGPKDPPCSYCNRCLLNVIEHPLGCYDERRFRQYGEKSYEEMIRRVMAIFPDKTDAGWL